MDLGLQGKRAAVAAGSVGLGFAVAKALAHEGVRVCICGRNPGTLRTRAGEIGAVPIVADLDDLRQARTFVRQSSTEVGGLDILVLNSGGPPIGSFDSSEFADYETALRGSFLSAVEMCREAVPSMKLLGWGRILASTTLAVRQPRPGNIMSGLARAGLTSFLKTLSFEVASCGITLNSLQPGLHQTARLVQLYGKGVGELAAGVPVKTLGQPDDFGQVAAFLCSDQARFITGTSLPIDGGLHSGIF